MKVTSNICCSCFQVLDSICQLFFNLCIYFSCIVCISPFWKYWWTFKNKTNATILTSNKNKNKTSHPLCLSSHSCFATWTFLCSTPFISLFLCTYLFKLFTSPFEVWHTPQVHTKTKSLHINIIIDDDDDTA